MAFDIVVTGADDPKLMAEIMPRCPGCQRMIRGTTKTVNGILYHVGCVQKGESKE